MKDRRTMWDHLGAGTLEGRRVRFLADDARSLVPQGSIGVVMSVCSDAALVEYQFPERGERNPWRTVHLESKFYCLELVDEEAAP